MKEKILSLFQRVCSEKAESINELAAHGSNRKYFRIKTKNASFIAVYNEDRKENEAFLSYADQMRERGIKVPKIYAEDLENNVYIQEDLGDETLFSFVKEHSWEENFPIYIKVLDCLAEIQMMENFDYTAAYPRKEFDRQSIQWDLNYFKYYFVKLAEIKFDEQKLEEDFQNLTSYLLSAERNYFLYRDFQSRNIMIKGDEVYFIDFQGGRKGALHYDLASLLFDGKVKMPHKLRDELLDYYSEKMSLRLGSDKVKFKSMFYAYACVRIMQAMGAYGYRGYFERKESFLQSIPQAIENLKYLMQKTVFPIELKELHSVFTQIVNSKKLQSLSKNAPLTVTIKSFSYKKGYPMDVSGNGGGFIFDCRALPNPGRYEKYKALTGKDSEVIEFLESKAEVKYFLDNVTKIVKQSIDNYLQRGFTHLFVAFGCTGGRHRSVFLAESLANELMQCIDLKIIINHVEQNL
ncbi:MAG: phosphotransferase [Bacteroidales bacterium]|nr:phosphotransferase [Bacteroidales bacterium]